MRRRAQAKGIVYGKKVFNDYLYTWYNCKSLYIILRGGAGSGKSVCVAQIAILKVLRNENFNVICFRKDRVHARSSTFAEIKKQIIALGVSHLFKINHTQMTFQVIKNKNVIVCTGLNDPEKIKSITTETGNFAMAWVEEATELRRSDDTTKDDLMQVSLRVRPDKYRASIYLSFNPIRKSHWLYDFTQEQVSIGDATEFFTSYKDNRFAPKAMVRTIERLVNTNTKAYNIYAKGMWGDIDDSLVYSNWKYIANLFKNNQIYTDKFYAIDFGWVKSKTAIVEIQVMEDIFSPHIRELSYAEYMQPEDIVACLESNNVGKSPIYCDSANPDKIELIRRAGFKAMPSNKSVDLGIEFVQMLQPKIDTDSENILFEQSNYEFVKDKDGRFVEGKMSGEDHLLDAIRYGLYTHYTSNRRYALALKYFMRDKRTSA